MSDDNVIRPAFGTPRRPTPEAPRAPLRVLGTGAGHRVGLIRDPEAKEGDVFRIVVGPEDEPGVETVALLPATADAEAEAERIGFAILRTLEMVEGAF
ncbi:hypothetical protein SAMN05216360_107107 [Methylobacterium phyllostachyos]|uniref:Uncharacterized protein n=1 Tax=Methylobacterium phyllostachyos TaxID=582672 RepID=A0A1H0A8G7_9HYPH|nr:hypothetical protein [Methylobacterium phyllostachyos]SDN29707.1 hypothetical protein SAMN05216360_107107 [Methylobacterium phyllostachyos]